jgi:hypothetical protein
MKKYVQRNVVAAAFALIATHALAVTVMDGGADGGKIESILNKWQPVAAAQGVDSATWRDAMRIQLRLVEPSTLDRLLAVGDGVDARGMGEYYQNFLRTLATDIHLRLNAQNANAAASSNAAVADASDGVGVAPKAIGSASIDQVFTPITPCRVVDTRNIGGPIGPFATRNFFFYTTSAATNWGLTQGGVNGAAGTLCPGTVISGYSPSNAVATITVTGQAGAGNLIVWQGTSPVASASTMSYPASGDTSSLATIPWGGRTGTGPGGAVQDFGVFVNAFTGTNVVVDIVGYYSAPAATALDCTRTLDTSQSIPNGLGNLLTSAQACATGYTMTGGGCAWLGNALAVYVAKVELSAGNAIRCAYNNFSGVTQTAFMETRCCRIPGH